MYIKQVMSCQNLFFVYGFVFENRELNLIFVRIKSVIKGFRSYREQIATEVNCVGKFVLRAIENILIY